MIKNKKIKKRDKLLPATFREPISTVCNSCGAVIVGLCSQCLFSTENQTWRDNL
jgi:hypothetical protein